VRDIVAAWRSGSSDDDVLTLPGSAAGGRVDISSGEIEVVEFAQFLSSWSGVNVIVPGEHSKSPKSMILVASDLTNVTPELVIALLRENGWRLRRSRLPGGEELYTLERRKR
jgi:predicted phosphohydrolase